MIPIHQRAKDFDRRSIRNGLTLFFVRFDQGCQDFGILLFFTRWIILLASLSRTDRYCSCWCSDVIGVGELTSSAYFPGTPIIIFATPSRRNPRDSECHERVADPLFTKRNWRGPSFDAVEGWGFSPRVGRALQVHAGRWSSVWRCRYSSCRLRRRLTI